MLNADGTTKRWIDMSPDERFLDGFRHFPSILQRWLGGRLRRWRFRMLFAVTAEEEKRISEERLAALAEAETRRKADQESRKAL